MIRVPRRVVTWGKFERLHERHVCFLEQARFFGDELYVVAVPSCAIAHNAARAAYASEQDRVAALQSLECVTDAFVDSFEKGLDRVVQIRPQLWVFGHDQCTQWEERLPEYLRSRGLQMEFVRLTMLYKGGHASDLYDKEKEK